MIGFALIFFSLDQMGGFTDQVSRFTIVWTGFVQVFGQGFVFVPLSTLALGTLPMEHRTEAASLFSLMRNLGSSIGVPMVVNLLARNAQINHTIPCCSRSSWGRN